VEKGKEKEKGKVKKGTAKQAAPKSKKQKEQDEVEVGVNKYNTKSHLPSASVAPLSLTPSPSSTPSS